MECLHWSWSFWIFDPPILLNVKARLRALSGLCLPSIEEQDVCRGVLNLQTCEKCWHSRCFFPYPFMLIISTRAEFEETAKAWKYLSPKTRFLRCHGQNVQWKNEHSNKCVITEKCQTFHPAADSSAPSAAAKAWAHAVKSSQQQQRALWDVYNQRGLPSTAEHFWMLTMPAEICSRIELGSPLLWGQTAI